MYSRIFTPPKDQSYFLWGPRGTGKSSFLKSYYGEHNYIDLLDGDTYLKLSATPTALLDYAEMHKEPIIIDEVQRVPLLLNEIHRLIEKKKMRFVLSGSSARALRRRGVNLLAGRALSCHMHPFVPSELKKEFSLKKALMHGLVPIVHAAKNPKQTLASYVHTYVTQEVQLEGLTRNIAAFSRFLQSASFSQASVLNTSAVAADAAVERKVVEDYFQILRDLMLSVELPVFSRRAKRELIRKSKFFFFDCGIFRQIKPRGPLDSESEITGAALETLVMQTVRAMNEYYNWEFELFYWHSRKHEEVDLVLYGTKGLIAIEVKSGNRLRDADFAGLRLFKEDYPEARTILLAPVSEAKRMGHIEIIPVGEFLEDVGGVLLSN